MIWGTPIHILGVSFQICSFLCQEVKSGIENELRHGHIVSYLGGKIVNPLLLWSKPRVGSGDGNSEGSWYVMIFLSQGRPRSHGRLPARSPNYIQHLTIATTPFFIFCRSTLAFHVTLANQPSPRTFLGSEIWTPIPSNGKNMQKASNNIIFLKLKNNFGRTPPRSLVISAGEARTSWPRVRKRRGWAAGVATSGVWWSMFSSFWFVWIRLQDLEDEPLSH